MNDIIVSPFVCYDLRFPELFQIASRKAHLITIAASWPAERKEHWITLLKARAIENQCYIAGVNRIGEGNKVQYEGNSIIVNPYGEIISEAILGEGIVSANVETSAVEKYRKDFPLKKDRRVELYKQLGDFPM
jgi:predicted amidohydrolase